MSAFFKSLSRLFNSPFELQVFGDSHCKVYGVEYEPLCECLSQLPCVVRQLKPRYLRMGAGTYAAFDFNGHMFEIEGDAWDEGLWIVPKDGVEHAEEMRMICGHLEQWGKRA
jgi:hypothetical protein